MSTRTSRFFSRNLLCCAAAVALLGIATTSQAQEKNQPTFKVEGQLGLSNTKKAGKYVETFKFSGAPLFVYTINLSSEKFDTYLRVVDSKGKVVLENDDIKEGNLNSMIRFMPSDKGYNKEEVFTVEVTSFGMTPFWLNQKGQPQAPYTLTIMVGVTF